IYVSRAQTEPVNGEPVNGYETRHKRGFTLLEILIALFIFAIVLSTIFASYTGTFRIINETESQADIYGMARIALERIQEDLESAYFFRESEDSKKGTAILSYQFVGEHTEIQGRSADTLSFVSRAHLVFGGEDEYSGTAAIAYYVRKTDEKKSLSLYRSDTPYFLEPPEQGTGGLILCDGLLSVSFTYYDADGVPYDNWDSTSEEFKDRLPVMVSVLLEFMNKADTETPFKFISGVAIPMAKGSYGKASQG
ncbi:MAG: prepilin-type N-terminal cleavage/methylation domain-containing protein, partial [Thermodesulfobacteriota bacterium]|nr:prepilin-type N-terminal cleavage/methylation domain-containing protein [Thermodesulfobacteriota bacterium]